MSNPHAQPYPYQPPRRSSTLKIVLIVLGVLMVLFCGGCLAVTGLFANEVDKAIEEEEQNDRPTTIAEGKAFEHDGYSVAAGWTVTRDSIGDVTITGMRVTNDGDGTEGTRTAWLDLTFEKGAEVLAEVSCTSQELSQGQTSAMDCSSLDDFPEGYDTIKVADAF